MREHTSALTLMMFLLIVASVFCDNKMDYLTPEGAQNDVQFSGHLKPWYCQQTLLHFYTVFYTLALFIKIIPIFLKYLNNSTLYKTNNNNTFTDMNYSRIIKFIDFTWSIS